MIFSIEQISLLVLVLSVLVFLLWGKVRYDIVAFSALIIGVTLNLIPQDIAFSGFGHPATIIIALVLIVSRGLSNSGVVELIVKYFSKNMLGFRWIERKDVYRCNK